MSNRDIPEFTAATLPPPQQWEGRTIWRSDLLCHQTSTGLEWRWEVTQDQRTGLLYAGGVPVAGGWSPGAPTDQLLAPLQRVTITGALSTTQAQTATASGTYYKARVVWNNNGASASAKLRIAVNADNAVHGLVVGQSAKRRDYELTMGDGVMLACGVPITSLTFSADGSITGATHQLQVTFGN